MAAAALGEPPPSRGWPYETPLSRDQRLAAQAALARQGFAVGEIDGVIGSGTRAALKAWQKSRGLTPDGYLNADMVRRLTAVTSG
jgi:peptidoglycan hydrolase-like protein with peptidoglycan-binding domain